MTLGTPSPGCSFSLAQSSAPGLQRGARECGPAGLGATTGLYFVCQPKGTRHKGFRHADPSGRSEGQVTAVLPPAGPVPGVSAERGSGLSGLVLRGSAGSSLEGHRPCHRRQPRVCEGASRRVSGHSRPPMVPAAASPTRHSTTREARAGRASMKRACASRAPPPLLGHPRSSAAAAATPCATWAAACLNFFFNFKATHFF